MKRAAAFLLMFLALCASGCARIAVPADSSDPSLTEAVDLSAQATPQPTACATAVVTEAPTPVPTETPTPEPTEIPTVMYKSRVNVLNVRSAPSMESDIVGRLEFEERIPYIGEAEEGFVSVLYNGEICYCYRSYLVPESQTLYGYVSPRFEYKTDKDGNVELDKDGEPITLTAELIDVRLVVPGIEVYQIFGTEENFTGEILYQRPVPVLQIATAKKLAAAAKIFEKDGYRIKLYDCYRPKSVQYILYDIVQNSAYIANPYKSASNHNRAAAVDITLIGPDGEELDFPTPMHTFNKSVYRSSRDEWTSEQRKNVDYMTKVMLEAGFKLINTEWWHFSDTDYMSFMVLDIDMRDIPVYPADRLGYKDPNG